MRRHTPVRPTAPLAAPPPLAALLCCLLLAASCSSAPPKREAVSVVKDRAVEATEFGNQYYRQGRYDTALSFFTQALELNVSVDNEAGVVQSYNSIGRVYMALDRFDLAEETFLKALPRAQALDDAELFFAASSNLGELYLKMGDPGRAIALFERALSQPLTPGRTAVLSHDLGTAYKATGDLVRARELLAKSLAINLREKQTEEAAADYYMLASVSSKEGDLAGAEKALTLALELDKKIENSLGIAKDLSALGSVSRRKGDAETAYVYLHRAYLVYTTIGIAAETRKALEELAGAAEASGRTAEASEYRALLAGAGK
jgi:tetratricopeptide (TPR) repeat protein